MLKPKIEKYFHQFPDLRVLFFFDEHQEHSEAVAQLELEGIRVLRWERNNFFLKTQLHGEWASEKVFLYVPQAAPKNREDYLGFPLLGLLIANKELSLDDVGAFMDEFHLQRHHKALASKYMRELQYTGVQEVLRPVLTPTKFEVPQLVQGLVSAFLRFTNITPWSVLLGKLLTLALPGEEAELARFQKKIHDNDLMDVLQAKSRDFFGLAFNDLSRETLLQSLRRIYYNQITQTLPEASSKDPYRELKIKSNETLLYLNQLLQEVERHKRVHEQLTEALALAGKDILGTKLLEVYGPEAAFAAYAPDMLWEIMALEQGNLSIQPAASIQRLEQLSMQSGLPLPVADCLQFMLQAARLFERINGIRSYILDSPDGYVRTYAEDWMQIDMAYRRAIRIYRNGDFTEASASLNLEAINAELNARYEKHLDAMNREWLRCMNQFGFDYRKLATPKQYDFFKTEVEPYDQKVVVIISDALRFEVAAELLANMHGDTKNTADLRYQLASLPSKTSVGMAQLLPSKTLAFNDGNITADGISTEGTSSRQQILLTHREEALALPFSQLLGKPQEELRDIFKSKVVYIYHDVIDSTGDDRKSERRVFQAVDETIQELKKLVKSLHASHNVARVLITADHGFLYNDRELEEKDKEDMPHKEAQTSHNRYVITDDATPPAMGFKIPLEATTRFEKGWYVTIPQSVNRYKKQGVGHQFVHGGGSLQELVVPVIESSRKRQEITRKVQPILLQRGGLRIVSSILRTQLLQENKVSRFEKEITLSAGIYKDLELVSNEQIIVMNSTADAPSERMHRVELTLSTAAAKESFLKLKVFDVEDKLNPLIDELVQNSTLIQADF
ncbi:MAG: BREX-1 system phosphatase PglZ type A [Lewinellaceae bacterium]|nr:BREX-1 system phosphatase PglZ type A [Saprospiraceae bacterium]MCB9339001.1 BREX-1 system phosphatase PglZ type A [Lewinellaceae bacterium]